MRRRRIVLALALLVPASGLRLPAQGVPDARDLVRSGKYAEGIAALQKVPRSDSAWIAAQRELARALALTSRYDNAETVARQATGAPGGRELWNTLGEILRERGKRAAAESAFVRAVAERASDSLTAALNLAVLHREAGDRDRATKEFDRFIDIYNARAAALTARELMAVAIACRYLGAGDPQLFKDAMRAFDRAVAADGDDLDIRIALGELFLEKFNGADAQATFGGVLAANPSHPRALIGEAKRLVFDGQPGADSLVARALAVSPEYVAGRVMLARELLDVERHADAQREVDRALAVNPSSADALAAAAAIRYVQGDRAAFDALRQRALAASPRDAGFHATMAEIAGRIRLYAAAADFAREGVAAEARSWRAHGLLGMNLLRLGKIDEGRQSLETAFKGDPYDIWIKNTLDLLDTFKNYDVITSERFRLMIEKQESAVLSIYLTDLAERAWATFSAKYAWAPPPPVRIEVYRSHADFSVRTVGLAGLGALGVSFGPTLAFDSPAAKDAGPFNWGSTVWHELAHTFTLGLTDNRVPRWLSEGLSVYEERHARPGWGDDVSIAFLTAFKTGKLAPASRLNDGFMRPAYPEQVRHSYFQASLVCDLIARDGGEKALLALLREYKAGASTEQAFQRALGTDPRQFDRKFDAYVRDRFATPLATLDELSAQMKAGEAFANAGRVDDAIAAYERARALSPVYGGGNVMYLALAKLYEAKGDARKAADALGQLVLHSDTDLGAHLELARLSLQLGDTAKAADALDRAMYIDPFDIARHQQLADLSHRLGDKAKVIRERRAVVALNPVDRAEALYRLALAYHEAGDGARARTSVLRALEEAPNYARAQELLLTIVEGRKP